MSLLLMLLAAQAAEPVVRKETFVTRTAWPKVTAEMVPYVRKYFDCLNPAHMTVPVRSDGKASEWMARERHTACAETRRWAVASSLASFKSTPDSGPDGAVFVNSAFDRIDQDHISQAQYVDRVIAGTVDTPDDNAEPILLESEASPK